MAFKSRENPIASVAMKIKPGMIVILELRLYLAIKTIE
jgi:hypothetical protein